MAINQPAGTRWKPTYYLERDWSSGTSSVSTAHAPLQKASEHGLTGQCSEGWYRHVCCPNKQMPSNCQWNYNEDWPVPPSWLWESAYEDDGDDVAWAFADNEENNNEEASDDPIEEDPADHAYGFLMLDGPQNPSIVPLGIHILSPVAACEKIFRKGAEDTIIKLPDHVGEGPFARVVSMTPASHTYELPHHHIRSRSLENNENDVYELKIDYNSHLIKRDDGPINMRIDYTNLLPYWDEDVKKRTASKNTSVKLGSGSTDMTETSESGLVKRWFGKFGDWLKKMNKVEAGNDGFLNMAFQKSFLLYRAVKGCARRTFYAEMRMYLDADVQMDATYAYYLSGTIVPLKVIDTYGYLGVEPSAYLGLRLEGNAIMTYTSEWKKLIDTLAYPGLSIKGIATVGPSLDIYGRIRGSVTLSGQAKAGARVHFGRAELYFPQDEEGTKGDTDYDKIDDIKSQQERPKTGLEPQFFASAQASANLAIDVSPNARIGIEVGPSVLGKGNLVNAQIIAFMNSTLDFSAIVTGSAGTDSSPTYSYKYGAYLYYNLGYGGFANILGDTWNWHYTPVYLYSLPGQKYTIYENSNVESDATLNSKRDIKILPDGDEKGLFHDDDDEDAIWNDNGLEPYVPPASHVHRRRTHMHLHHKAHHSYHDKSNATSHIPNVGSVIFKRADVDDDATDPPRIALYVPILPFCVKGLLTFINNCRTFSTIQVVAQNGPSKSVRGICDGIFGWFASDGASSDGVTLTWDPNRRDARDVYTCNGWTDYDDENKRNSYCTSQKKALNEAAGLPEKKMTISCDEFPFGGTEEGGDWGAKYKPHRVPPTANCVPQWQQSLQGNCNKLLSSLYTNVAYFDRDVDSDKEDWKWWSKTKDDERWTPGGSESDTNPPVFGRLTRYPEPVPLAHGIDRTEWENSGRTLGYNFKRNFTMALAYATSLSDTPDQWGKMALNSSQIKGASSDTDPTHVFCAVNLFNQPDVYRYGSGNGFCLDTRKGTNGMKKESGFGQSPGYTMCKVNYIGSTFSDQTAPASYSKRDQNELTGENNEWEIESIELHPDENVWWPLPDDVDWEDTLNPGDTNL
ncbi:hypothetical protein N7444_002164, partial [Penicillium canescens]